MSITFIKFPRTPHLYGEIKYRKDLQLSEEETREVFSQPLVIQEKIDGTNLGIRFDWKEGLLVQKRRGYVDYREEEFKKLSEWCEINSKSLLAVIEDQRILFGDWLYAKHTIYYDQLPSYFLAYDLYDLEKKKFLSQKKLQEILSWSEIKTIPTLFGVKVNSRKELEALIGKSAFGRETVEGLYLRIDSQDFNEGRYKIVRKEFQQRIKEHWKKRILVPNLSLDEREKYWSGGRKSQLVTLD